MTRTKRYRIMARHHSYSPVGEEVDTADDLKTAEYLCGEYRLAYGAGWNVWYKPYYDAEVTFE